jgi:hypothetical protein
VANALKYFIHILQKTEKLYCFVKAVHSRFCCMTVLVADKQPSSVVYNVSQMLNEINKTEKCTSVFQSLKFHSSGNVSYTGHFIMFSMITNVYNNNNCSQPQEN